MANPLADHCKICWRRDKPLTGINGDLYCPDHIEDGIAEAFKPLHELRRQFGGT